MNHKWISIRSLGAKKWTYFMTEMTLWQCRTCKDQKTAPQNTPPDEGGCEGFRRKE